MNCFKIASFLHPSMHGLEGTIFKYNKHGSIAFKNNIVSKKTVILIGGLGDNLLSLPYIESINRLCSEKKFAFIVPQLRSMPNFEIFPVESDIEDISDLISEIDGNFVLIGHSTGCNNILLFLEKGIPENLSCIILQGPVSDTESIDRSYAENVLSKISNCKTAYIETEDGRIWLKERFVSLYSIKGQEDLFSSYLDDSVFENWKSRLPILSVISGNDEYCDIDMTEKFRKMGDVCFISNGNHSLSDKNAMEVFISAVDNFLSKHL